MVIQFGHNDAEKVDGVAEMPRQVSMAEYEANLRRYITEARAVGIKPVLCTPLTRRFFQADGKIHSDLLAHAATMQRVAADMKVPVIDLHSQSTAYLDKIGEQKANELAITKKDDAGKTIFDKTHLDWQGSYVFGRMVAVGLGSRPARTEEVCPPHRRGASAARPQSHEGHPGRARKDRAGRRLHRRHWRRMGPGLLRRHDSQRHLHRRRPERPQHQELHRRGRMDQSPRPQGDYYLIQFGHNDQKTDPERHTDAEGSFKDYLQRYIDDVRAIGAVPVLVTSLSRRTFKDGKVVEDLHDYAQATREVGAKKFITVIDLNALSTAMLNRLGQEEADKFDALLHPDATADNRRRRIESSIAPT